MCKEVEKVLKETAKNEPLCMVIMEEEPVQSNDFVCVMARENGDASIFYNTDAITLGMAMKMVAKAFVDAMGQLSEEERTMVSDILGDAFFLERPQEEPVNE